MSLQNINFKLYFSATLLMFLVTSCSVKPDYHLLNFRTNKIKQKDNFVHVFHEVEEVPSIAIFLKDTTFTFPGPPFDYRLDLIENELTKFGQEKNLDLIHIRNIEPPNYHDRFYTVKIDIYDFELTKEYLLEKYNIESGIFFYREFYIDDLPNLPDFPIVKTNYILLRTCQGCTNILMDSLNNQYCDISVNETFLLPINSDFGPYTFYVKSQKSKLNLNIEKGEIYFINCFYYNDTMCRVIFEQMDLVTGWDYWRKIKNEGK